MYNRVKKDNVTAMIASIAAFALGVIAIIVLLSRVASAQERRVTQPALNGGRVAYTISDDGKTIIQKFADGTVSTNAIKFANTPIEAVPRIESALRKQIIVDAALAVESGDADTKLQLAAARATETLRLRSVETRELDGGETQPPTREVEPPTTKEKTQ